MTILKWSALPTGPPDTGAPDTGAPETGASVGVSLPPSPMLSPVRSLSADVSAVPASGASVGAGSVAGVPVVSSADGVAVSAGRTGRCSCGCGGWSWPW